MRLKPGSIPSVNLPKQRLELLGILKPKSIRKPPMSRENVDPMQKKRRRIEPADASVATKENTNILLSTSTSISPRCYVNKMRKSLDRITFPSDSEHEIHEIPSSNEISIYDKNEHAIQSSNKAVVCHVSDVTILLKTRP